MAGIPASTEVEQIRGVVANFDWKLIKQEITETDITLTIKKTISPAGEISSSPAD